MCIIKLLHGQVIYNDSLLSAEANYWMRIFRAVLYPKFQYRPIIVHGVNAREPRDVLYFGDNGISHLKYSGI